MNAQSGGALHCVCLFEAQLIDGLLVSRSLLSRCRRDLLPNHASLNQGGPAARDRWPGLWVRRP
jgi:hypothetical protein